MKHTKGMQEGYVAPVISLLDVAVEAGFATSSVSGTWAEMLNESVEWGTATNEFE